jgi:hypothetical protein
MEALLSNMLQKYLGQMLLGFNARKSAKFKFSLSGGQKCVLKDLKLDPAFLSTWIPGIPFVVESGIIDQITVHAKLQSIKTEPTVVEIGTVEIVIRESPLSCQPSSQLTNASSRTSLNSADEDRGSTSKLRESGSGSSLASSSTQKTKHVRGQSAGSSSSTSKTRESPWGTLRKGDKKKYNLAQKVGDGIHWKVHEIRIALITAGKVKSDDFAPAPSFVDPPTINVVVRELDFYSTDEHGNKCDLKRARAYGKDLEDINYLFKGGSFFLSLFLTPANPWFSDVNVLETTPVKLRYVSVFEPKWLNSKGEDVTIELARSLDVVCEDPILCHLNGDDLLHVGECLGALFSALYLNAPSTACAHVFGRYEIPKQTINLVVPELVLSAVLDGPNIVRGSAKKGLALQVVPTLNAKP